MMITTMAITTTTTTTTTAPQYPQPLLQATACRVEMGSNKLGWWCHWTGMERRTNNINMGGDSNNNSDDEDHGNEEKQKNTQEMLASLGPQVSFSS